VHRSRFCISVAATCLATALFVPARGAAAPSAGTSAIRLGARRLYQTVSGARAARAAAAMRPAASSFGNSKAPFRPEEPASFSRSLRVRAVSERLCV